MFILSHGQELQDLSWASSADECSTCTPLALPSGAILVQCRRNATSTLCEIISPIIALKVPHVRFMWARDALSFGGKLCVLRIANEANTPDLTASILTQTRSPIGLHDHFGMLPDYPRRRSA